MPASFAILRTHPVEMRLKGRMVDSDAEVSGSATCSYDLQSITTLVPAQPSISPGTSHDGKRSNEENVHFQ